jgi:hypothetical protein
MKIFVNFIQILLITGMVYPVYAMWNNDQINNYCADLKSMTTKQKMLDLAEQKNIKVKFERIDELLWRATATRSTSFSDYSCQINGMGERLASAKMAVKQN